MRAAPEIPPLGGLRRSELRPVAELSESEVMGCVLYSSFDVRVVERKEEALTIVTDIRQPHTYTTKTMSLERKMGVKN